MSQEAGWIQPVYSLECFVVALCLADTDVGDTLVGHNGLNICEVKVDKTGTLIRSVMYSLKKDLIGFL